MKLNPIMISISIFVALVLLIIGGVIFFENMSNNSLVTISTGSVQSAQYNPNNSINKYNDVHKDSYQQVISTLSNEHHEDTTTFSPKYPAPVQNTDVKTIPTTLTVHSTLPTTSTTHSTGNFSDIMNGNSYLIGTIEGDTIIIPLKDGIMSNNQLILHEYYVDKLDETFTLKVDSLGNNNFIMYEYFNNINTGIFKLKCTPTAYSSNLSGTFSKPGSSEVFGIKFYSFNRGLTDNYPFFNGIVNGTPVTFAQTANSSGFFEKYSGDNNIFNLKSTYNQSLSKEYNNILIESFNGKVTGQYDLNSYDNGEILKGFYIPSSNQKLKYPVTFTGSFNP